MLNAATQQVLRSVRTTKPILVDDPLRVVPECIEIPNAIFRNRGRHACRLSVHVALLRGTGFDVDRPRLPELKGRTAAVAGVGPDLPPRMRTDFSGLDSQTIREARTRPCRRSRIGPEEFPGGRDQGAPLAEL